MRYISWLQDIRLEHADLVGAKAARLGEALSRGFPVPAGFCITTDAQRHNVGMTPELLSEIQEACRQLASPTVAIRSSSPTEDLSSSSFAGQYATFLDVPPSDVPARVVECWTSAANTRSASYRRQHGLPRQPPDMAVLVQTMLACDASGVAFSCDPLSGADTVIIEAAPGAGENVVSGRVIPHHYTLHRLDASPIGDDLLPSSMVRRIADLVLAVEQSFGGPQDIEWGVVQGRLFLLQARPITTGCSPDGIFTELSDPDTTWTSGFFNERFVQPVSPLGWSLLRNGIERYALLQPLQFLGVADCQTWPLTRLFRGHPYANMRIFQTLYKVFPTALLPEDALRFFVNRDASLRLKVPYPLGLLDPRFLVSMLRHFVRDPSNWSPLHNWRLWARFARQYDLNLDAIRARLDAPGADLLGLADDIQKLNERLLAIHRWSLTDADIFYTLLRTILRLWTGPTGADLAARLTIGLDNLSLQTNRALASLRDLSPMDNRFGAAQADFLARFGHRSPSLDIYHPTYADDPAQVLALAHAPPEQDRLAGDLRRQAEAQVHAALTSRFIERVAPLRWLLTRWVIAMARRYLPLREDQRFYWQKGLALLRRIYLRLGQDLVGRGILERASDIFFLTDVEVAAVGLQANADEVKANVDTRHRVFERLTADWLASPSVSYPAFLHGNTPLVPAAQRGAVLRGLAVSPGMARGPACVLLSSDDMTRVPDACILIVPSADPAWTPLFTRVAGVIMETGGQLSHTSVVAREYRLPAVAAIPGVTSTIRDGETVTVDGSAGAVLRDSLGTRAPEGGETSD